MDNKENKDSKDKPLNAPPKLPAKFDFDLFLRHLRSKKADPIIRYVKSFLRSFTQKRWTVEEQSKLLMDFKEFIFARMHDFEPFSKMNEEEFDNSKAGMEKLIMTKLYDICYSPAIASSQIDESHKQDIKLDEELTSKFKVFISSTPNELKLDEELITKGSEFIKLAAIELQNVNNFKVPRAKIVCILNCCKILFQLIKNTDNSQNADEFLPLLIFTLLQSQCQNLYSNLNYIERFSFTKTSEIEYYLISLNAAAEFIRRLDQDEQK